MANTSILDDILKELKRAKKKHPVWPDHVVARAAIVNKEAGELAGATLKYKYELKRYQKEGIVVEMKKEAIQTAVTCIRFLETIKDL